MVDKLDYMHKFLYTMQQRSTFINELIHKKRYHDQEMLRKIRSNQYFRDDAEKILDIIGRDSLFKKVLRYEGRQSLRYITFKYAKILKFVNHQVGAIKGKDFDRLEDMGIPALRMKSELSHVSVELSRKAEQLHEILVQESEHLKEGKLKEYLEDLKTEEEIERRVAGLFNEFTDSVRAFENKIQKILSETKNSAFFPYNTTLKVVVFASVVGAFIIGFMQGAVSVIPGSAALAFEGMRRYLHTAWTAVDEHELRQIVNEFH